MLGFNLKCDISNIENLINDGYFDNDVYSYLKEILSVSDSLDSKNLLSGHSQPFDFFDITCDVESGYEFLMPYDLCDKNSIKYSKIVELFRMRVISIFSNVKNDLFKIDSLSTDSDILVDLQGSFLTHLVNIKNIEVEDIKSYLSDNIISFSVDGIEYKLKIIKEN